MRDCVSVGMRSRKWVAEHIRPSSARASSLPGKPARPVRRGVCESLATGQANGTGDDTEMTAGTDQKDSTSGNSQSCGTRLYSQNSQPAGYVKGLWGLSLTIRKKSLLEHPKNLLRKVNVLNFKWFDVYSSESTQMQKGFK